MMAICKDLNFKGYPMYLESDSLKVIGFLNRIQANLDETIWLVDEAIFIEEKIDICSMVHIYR